MLNRKEDWQAAFGNPSPAFDARMRQTLNHLEEEKTVKKFSLRMAVLVLALILALTGAVYAATNVWTIGDYFNQRYGDNVNAPRDFDSGFAGNFTQELDGLTFHIRDAYVDGNQLSAIVEISRADGQPALFRGEDIMEDDPIGDLYLEMQEDEAGLMPVAEYARQHNLPLYWVGMGFCQADQVLTGGADYWMEDGSKRLAYFLTAEDVQVEEGQAKLQWRVYVYPEDGGPIHRQEIEITVPVEPLKTWSVEIQRPVEGLPVVLDQLNLAEGRMGLHLEYVWHIDESQADTELARAIQQVDINLWFRAIDPDTGEELPGGATLGGSYGSPDDVHFVQSGDSVSASFQGDTLYIQPYDAWEKNTYGVIEVKIREE
ncbi:MAG: hypothetical protein IJ189_05225 [Clostridia bacterium]|nr:hypothetical protein [Clostridia bacterium]